MQENIVLPQGLRTAIGSERQLFVTRANRIEPLNATLIKIGLRVSIVLITFFVSLLVIQASVAPNITQLADGDVSIEMNSKDMDSVFGLIIWGGLFLLAGLYLIRKGILALWGDGGIYVGTPSRLWHFYRGNTQAHKWERFLEPKVKSKEKGWVGTVILPLKSSTDAKDKTKKSVLANDISLCEIKYAFEIEQICRKQIAAASSD